MNIQVYLPCFEEADLLGYTIGHWLSQGPGINIHVIDGWSEDGSWELLRSFGSRVTCERFPRRRPSELIWNCTELLTRVEFLAKRLEADWCYLSDADEIRRSDMPDESLEEAIARVDFAGYNVIDHVVYSFFPVDDGWPASNQSPEQYFRWFDPHDMIATLPQQKAWKNNAPVDLVSSGGHVITRQDRQVVYRSFVLKHYPFRSTEQAQRKLVARFAMRCEPEHARGWGVHYDRYREAGFTGLRRREELREFV